MPDGVNLALALLVASRLLDVAQRALDADRDVTDAELKDAFARADAAEARWHKVNRERANDREQRERQ
jgi:hypothetical protein